MNKLKRKECLAKYPKFPRANYYHNKFYYPDSAANYLLTIDSTSADNHIKTLSFEIIKLLDHLKIGELIFLGDTSSGWLSQDNDFKKVKEVYAYFEANKTRRTFNGGLIVNKGELPEFLKHLFWLGRCNASFPSVYFMDNEQNFVANICKYGSLHLSWLNPVTEGSINTFLSQNKFLIQITGCFEPFSRIGRIKGRRAIIR